MVGAAKQKPFQGPAALVLAPTRELAVQIEGVCTPLQRLEGLRCVGLIGGVSKDDQVDRLLSPTHMIVATPGRLIELIRDGTVDLSSIVYVALDEVDRLLSLGFKEQIDSIFGRVRPDRQLSFFSATCPKPVQELIEQWMPDPVFIRTRHPNAPHDQSAAHTSTESGSDGKATDAPLPPSAATSITQTVHVCSTHKKPRKIIRFISRIRTEEREAGIRQKSSMLIFCNKIKTVQFLENTLSKHGVKVSVLHGQLVQDVCS